MAKNILGSIFLGSAKEYANNNDDTGNSDGTWNGTEDYDVGKFGDAGDFDGSSYVDVNLPEDIDSAYTLSAWVRLDSGSYEGAVFADDAGHILQIGGGNVWQFNNIWNDEVVAETGQWVQLVAVYDNGAEHLYVNGENVADGFMPDRAVLSHIYIGKRNDNKFIDGKIDDVMIFSRALSADEVSSLYSAESNQYDHIFSGADSGEHSFKSYVVDTEGNKVATEERTVTTDYDAPVLFEVTSIPPKVRAKDAKYYFEGL